LLPVDLVGGTALDPSHVFASAEKVAWLDAMIGCRSAALAVPGSIAQENEILLLQS